MTSFHPESPAEFFKEQVEQAFAHQKLDSSQNTAFYLVQLLQAFIRPERLYAGAGVNADSMPGEILCQALASRGRQKMALLRLAGDLSLYFTGFQSEHLQRRNIGLDYYIQLGGYAYATIASSRNHHVDIDLFEELASNFRCFVDILSEVSEQCSLGDDRHLLALYEKWLYTGSERIAATLRRQGIMLAPGADQVQ